MPPADDANGDVKIDTYDQDVGADVNLPIGNIMRMSGKVWEEGGCPSAVSWLAS